MVLTRRMLDTIGRHFLTCYPSHAGDLIRDIKSPTDRHHSERGEVQPWAQGRKSRPTIASCRHFIYYIHIFLHTSYIIWLYQEDRYTWAFSQRIQRSSAGIHQYRHKWPHASRTHDSFALTPRPSPYQVCHIRSRESLAFLSPHDATKHDPREEPPLSRNS